MEKHCFQSVFQSEGVPSLSHATADFVLSSNGGEAEWVNESGAKVKVSVGGGGGGRHYSNICTRCSRCSAVPVSQTAAPPPQPALLHTFRVTIGDWVWFRQEKKHMRVVGWVSGPWKMESLLSKHHKRKSKWCWKDAEGRQVWHKVTFLYLSWPPKQDKKTGVSHQSIFPQTSVIWSKISLFAQLHHATPTTLFPLLLKIRPDRTEWASECIQWIFLWWPPFWNSVDGSTRLRRLRLLSFLNHNISRQVQ